MPMPVVEAETVIVPLTVAPATGETIATDIELFTVTTEDADVVPWESRAIARMVCNPAVAPIVFQAIVYGAEVISVPRLTPSILNWTPATTPVVTAEIVTVP